jgi:hypothetical protein
MGKNLPYLSKLVKKKGIIGDTDLIFPKRLKMDRGIFFDSWDC